MQKKSKAAPNLYGLVAEAERTGKLLAVHEVMKILEEMMKAGDLNFEHLVRKLKLLSDKFEHGKPA